MVRPPKLFSLAALYRNWDSIHKADTERCEKCVALPFSPSISPRLYIAKYGHLVCTRGCPASQSLCTMGILACEASRSGPRPLCHPLHRCSEVCRGGPAQHLAAPARTRQGPEHYRWAALSAPPGLSDLDSCGSLDLIYPGAV